MGAITPIVAIITANPTTAASAATPSLPVRPSATPMAKINDRLPKMALPACAMTFDTVAGSTAKRALPTPRRMPAAGSTDTGSINDLPIFCSQPKAARQGAIASLA
jgi:hypothetical protein